VGIVGLGFMAATHLKAYRQIDACRIAATLQSKRAQSRRRFSTVTGNVGSGEPLKLDMTRGDGSLSQFRRAARRFRGSGGRYLRADARASGTCHRRA